MYALLSTTFLWITLLQYILLSTKCFDQDFVVLGASAEVSVDEIQKTIQFQLFPSTGCHRVTVLPKSFLSLMIFNSTVWSTWQKVTRCHICQMIWRSEQREDWLQRLWIHEFLKSNTAKLSINWIPLAAVPSNLVVFSFFLKTFFLQYQIRVSFAWWRTKVKCFNWFDSMIWYLISPQHGCLFKLLAC